jgi:tetratricopeptide (TPR) repeat protein
MKVAGKTITVLLAMTVMMAPMARSQQQPEMSYRQAQRAIMRAMSYSKVTISGPHEPHPDNVRLTQDTLEFDAKDRHFTIPLKGLRKLTTDCNEYACEIIEEGSKNHYGDCFLTKYNTEKKWARLDFGFEGFDKGKICSQAQNHDECMNAASQFAAALNGLHIYALRPTTPDEDFQKQAMAWRALAEKPALPDAVRVRRMMAEDAIKNKKPEDALRYYEQTLEEYSTWPEGWFNAALVAGELGRYSDATDYMQNYLELVPDAKDAQSARDQLEIWKIKAQEKR